MGSAEQPPRHPGEPPAGQPPPGDTAEWEAAGLGARVNEIVDAVEREAAKLRHEAEQEAAQIRYQAQEEARRYVDHARQQSEALAAQRMERIRDLSDTLMARAEEVLERLEYAVPVKEGFENLVRALGETAERLASQDYSEFSEPSWDAVRGGAPAKPAQPAPAQGYSTPSPGYAAPAPGGSASRAPGGYAPSGQGAPPSGAPPQAPTAGQPGPAGGWQELDDAHRIAIQMAAAGSTRGEVEAHLVQAPAATRASVLDEIFGPGSPADTRVPWAAPPR